MERPPLPSPNVLFWIGVVLETSFIAVAALAGWLLVGEPFPRRPVFDLIAGGQAALALIPPALYALVATSRAGLRFAPFRRVFRVVETILGDVIRELTPGHLFLLAVAAGFGEEFLFRGVLQSQWGLIASSLVFALLHALTPTYLLLAFLLSLYLGWLLQVTGNLAVPALVHSAYDFIALLLIRRELAQDGPGPREGNDLPSDPER